MKAELALVIDFGGQHNQLLVRRIREMAIYCEIVPYDISYEEILEKQPQALIFSEGFAEIEEGDAPKCDPRIFSMEIPILGIGYGMQLMVQELGGTVQVDDKKEYTSAELIKQQDSPLWEGINDSARIWLNYGSTVQTLPEGFAVLGSDENCPIVAIGDVARKFYGVQFRPEVKETLQGQEILKNFLVNIAGFTCDWDLDKYINAMVEEIKAQVGEHKVLCALSGGVDSSVAAVLVHKAVGDKLVCVYVDHGLMRKGENEQVLATFREHLGINLVFAERSQQFLNKLAGVSDPEAKRKIIGHEFIRVFEEEAGKLGKIDFLVQGTIYPDIVESGSKTSGTVKSHHNVGGLPEDMTFELVEPLRHLFKDEVRVIGEKLGISADIVWRQPFPGPGLGVRVLGEITLEKVELLREADAIVREEIEKAGLTRSIWQSFAVLPPVKSVGVTDGARTYGYPIIIRAVESEDAMTAEWVRMPYEILDIMARRIVNEIPGINRVAYDITGKPPGTIEWE